MPKGEGNSQGRHFTEDEHQDDLERNHNQSKGRKHYQPENDQKGGGHSDRHASDTTGQKHEFRDPGNDDDANRHDEPQSDGHMQGTSRNQGGHQGGRNQRNN